MSGDVMANRLKSSHHTVRWKTQRSNTSNNKDNFVESRTARLVITVQQKDVEGLRMQLMDLKQQTMVADATNVRDEFAVSLLEHAVRAGSPELLDVLLDSCQTTEERHNAIERTILFAIKSNSIDMCHHALQLNKLKSDVDDENEQEETSLTYLNEDSTELASQEGTRKGRHAHRKQMADVVALRMRTRNPWHRTLSTLSQMDASEFSEEMTPIVMAAQLERTEIIRLLIDEHADKIHPLTKIPRNHNCSSCYVCQEQVQFVGQQTIEACRKAIEVYKALSSPAYMFQAGVEDPILEAFMISDIMEQRKVIDPAFVVSL